MASVKVEWGKLKKRKVWDDSVVMEWADKARNARNSGQKIHLGRAFGICVEKHPELPEDHPDRKYKYRVVFQGNQVVDESWEAAVFRDLGSSPASQQAGKFADVYGAFKGHSCEQGDASQAYVQAELTGLETWIALPPEAWPDEWWNDDGSPRFVRPVVRLIRALYGHPDAGTCWEQKCDKVMKEKGFAAVECWPSCYFHHELKVFMVVYVDDFKNSGPTGNLAKAWALIKDDLEIEIPDKPGLYLGCMNEKWTTTNASGNSVNVVTYNMKPFMESCVTRYLDLCEERDGVRPQLRKAMTPYLHSDHRKSPSCAPHTDGEAVKCPWCKTSFDLANPLPGLPPPSGVRGDSHPSCGENSSTPEGVGGKQKRVRSKDGSSGGGGLAAKNENGKVNRPMNKLAASVLMKLLYGARMAKQE
ncbi:MAG: hypothetical protein GY767_20865, partial [Shimia sp.]|nr:hypothetical protein [Shimia sp.]